MKHKQPLSLLALTVSAVLLSACGSTGTPGSANAGPGPIPAPVPTPPAGGGASSGSTLTNLVPLASSGINSTQNTGIQNLLKAAADGKVEITVNPRSTSEYSSYDDTVKGNHDAAMLALKNNASGTVSNLSKLGGTAAYSLDTAGDNVVYLRDPAKTGQEYSRIGFTINTNGAGEQAYVAGGTVFVPDDNTSVQAQYSGALLGMYEQKSEVVADFAATLNWGAAAKTLDVTVSNAHIATDNITLDKYVPLQADPRFDFKETLNWDGAAKTFTGGGVKANLYGSQAAGAREVAGTFDREVGGQQYDGAFFGIKQ